jgi:hypothetical protein
MSDAAASSCEALWDVVMAGLSGFINGVVFAARCCHSVWCNTCVWYCHVPHTLGGGGAGVCAASLQLDGTGGHAPYDVITNLRIIRPLLW